MIKNVENNRPDKDKNDEATWIDEVKRSGGGGGGGGGVGWGGVGEGAECDSVVQVYSGEVRGNTVGSSE